MGEHFPVLGRDSRLAVDVGENPQLTATRSNQLRMLVAEWAYFHNRSAVLGHDYYCSRFLYLVHQAEAIGLELPGGYRAFSRRAGMSRHFTILVIFL